MVERRGGGKGGADGRDRGQQRPDGRKPDRQPSRQPSGRRPAGGDSRPPGHGHRQPAQAKSARPLPRAVQVPDSSDTAQSAAGREVKLHGVNACRAYVAHRRDNIIRA